MGISYTHAQTYIYFSSSLYTASDFDRSLKKKKARNQIFEWNSYIYNIMWYFSIVVWVEGCRNACYGSVRVCIVGGNITFVEVNTRKKEPGG